MKYVVDSPAGERLTGVKELSPYLADYYTREGYTLTLYVRPLRIAAGVREAVARHEETAAMCAICRHKETDGGRYCAECHRVYRPAS